MKLTPIQTPHGVAVKIELTGDDVATAIDAWLIARRVVVCGARSISVNGNSCISSEVYVDPSGYVLRKGDLISLPNTPMSRLPSSPGSPS